MQDELFAEHHGAAGSVETLADGVALLHGHALAQAMDLVAGVVQVTEASPFRHMVTPGGLSMSVGMSNCGPLGWVSDRQGYRYARLDPETGKPWPPMPHAFAALARDAAELAGFPGFQPDACLINRYAPGTKLSLHQDKDEKDFTAPIVSVSLGLPAVFALGGLHRKDPVRRIPVLHGDVIVWGGPARLRYHAVLPIKAGTHAATGAHRINLTFRKAGGPA